MVETSIIRDPNESDKKRGEDGYAVAEFIGSKKKVKTVTQIFNEDLTKKYQEVTSKKDKDGVYLPFAIHAAKFDFNKHFTTQREKARNEKGFLENSDFTMFKPDWNKYSDLKNFELLGEKEVVDQNLTKTNPGLYVTCKMKKYKFKGFSNTYKCMEDGPSAIRRAQERLSKSRS